MLLHIWINGKLTMLLMQYKIIVISYLTGMLEDLEEDFGKAKMIVQNYPLTRHSMNV